jgi:hypothetical protein
MRGILKVGLVALGLVAAGAPALADKAFDAEDAAYVDWSYRHCQTMSTAKEHALADTANAGGEKYHAQYLKEVHKIADVERSTEQITRLCATIQDRYGPNASLIPDLISARGEKPSDSITAEKPAAQPAAAPQKRHGRPH